MVCEQCGKKMPPNILEAHKKKSHPIEQPKEPKFVNKYETIQKNQAEKLRGWNWGELNECGQCQKVFPSEIMAFHMHVQHGM